MRKADFLKLTMTAADNEARREKRSRSKARFAQKARLRKRGMAEQDLNLITEE